MQTGFDIEEKYKKFVMMEAGNLHRQWRTRLTTGWLRDKDGNINEHPPAKYAQYIRLEDWQAFVAKHMDSEFQVCNLKCVSYNCVLYYYYVLKR